LESSAKGLTSDSKTKEQIRVGTINAEIGNQQNTADPVSGTAVFVSK
jgi:hypothetical protein